MSKNKNSTSQTILNIYSSKTELLEDFKILIWETLTEFNNSQTSTYNPDELLTIQQVCEQYDTCSSSLANYRKKGLYPCLSAAGETRKVFYKRSELQNFFGSSIYDKPTRNSKRG